MCNTLVTISQIDKNHSILTIVNQNVFINLKLDSDIMQEIEIMISCIA